MCVHNHWCVNRCGRHVLDGEGSGRSVGRGRHIVISLNADRCPGLPAVRSSRSGLLVGVVTHLHGGIAGLHEDAAHAGAWRRHRHQQTCRQLCFGTQRRPNEGHT